MKTDLSSIAFGLGEPADVVVPGDYDGDGRTDLAVYRPSSGAWHILESHSSDSAGVTVTLGGGTDVPVPSDFDGDGKTDMAVYHQTTGTWEILKSSNGATMIGRWGTSSDVPLPRHP